MNNLDNHHIFNIFSLGSIWAFPTQGMTRSSLTFIGNTCIYKSITQLRHNSNFSGSNTILALSVLVHGISNNFCVARHTDLPRPKPSDWFIPTKRQPETANGFISQHNQPQHGVNTTITTYSVYDARNIYTNKSQLRLKSLIVGIVATDAAEHAI